MAGQIDYSWEDILPDGKLPGDVMVSILSNLPVKSLLKFKAVSKPWFSLISSPRFLKQHLHRQSVIANNLIMSLNDWEGCIYGLLTHNHDKNSIADSDVLFLESPLLLHREKSIFIIESCNGLVCMLREERAGSDGLILWNPATRKYRSLEPPMGDYRVSFNTLGLCYVEATNDFKIVVWALLNIPVYTPRLFVYSLSSDSWEMLDFDEKKKYVIYGPPTFMNGCMHWLTNTCTCTPVCTCRSRKAIMAFNVTDGIMSMFGVPDNGTSWKTFVIRGCLSYVNYPNYELLDSEIEVWVMEEYGVEGSWVKRFTFQGSNKTRIPLMSWNDGDILFISNVEVSNILTFYNPFSKNKYFLEFTSFYINDVYNYVESLVSVKPEVEIAPFQLVEG